MILAKHACFCYVIYVVFENLSLLEIMVKIMANYISLENLFYIGQYYVTFGKEKSLYKQFSLTKNELFLSKTGSLYLLKQS